MIKIGFTGTQIGMTDKQKETFATLVGTILKVDSIEFHHGDCVGADSDAHDIVSFFGCEIVIHPPVNERKRAFKKGKCLEPKQYIVRNHDIVNESKFMIATPKSKKEELRSGTWATIRYAKKNKKKIYIIYHDGSHKIAGVV